MTTKTINENSLLSDKEMHLLYGFSPKTLQNHRTKRIGITYIKIGKMVRYRKGDVDEYLNNRKVKYE
jgi:predicted DNA-binding transcriptional regulator AlpA